MEAHLNNADHGVCVDVNSGSVFCTECDDFVYDAIFQGIWERMGRESQESRTGFQGEPNTEQTILSWCLHVMLEDSKKLREPFKPYSSSTVDQTLLSTPGNYTPIPCQSRRALLNLGQTCFLNVILQSLIHNPLLRNYFLSGKHDWRVCTNAVGACMCCEMDILFGDVYSNKAGTPYGPASLLSTTWRSALATSSASSTSSKHSSNPDDPLALVGYAQQDAHEFFISILNAIHGSSRGSTNVSCNCIVHRSFAGVLLSEVRCGGNAGGGGKTHGCGTRTKTLDPFLDISVSVGGAGSGGDTLAGCLRRYTKEEKLGLKEYACTKCGGEASKRLSFKKLPGVLSFQLKVSLC